ncbi:MAG: hypothetical protein ACR2OJ_08510 [Hyphomicrobiales bacterium]
MSQFEIIMVAVLGLAVVTLAILLVARGVWSFGDRKSRRRKSKYVPETSSEIQAERDRLRAEFAVMSRKQDIQIRNLKNQLTEYRANASRDRNKIDDLSAELEQYAQQAEDHEKAAVGFRETMTPLEAELETRTTSLHRLKEELRVKTEELERLTHENAAYKRREAKKDLAISRFEKMIADGTKNSPVAQRILNEAAQDEALQERSPSTPKLLRRGLFKKNSGTPPHEDAKPLKAQKTNKLTAAIKASRQNDQTQDETAPPVQTEKPPTEGESKPVDAGVTRAKRRKVLSLAKRIQALQEEAEG